MRAPKLTTNNQMAAEPNPTNVNLMVTQEEFTRLICIHPLGSLNVCTNLIVLYKELIENCIKIEYNLQP